MKSLIQTLLGRTRVLVRENERVLVLSKGLFHDILEPGEHYVPARDLVLERHSLVNAELVTDYADALVAQRPSLVARHLTVLQADRGEVAVLYRDGVLMALVIGPSRKRLFFRAAGPLEVRTFPLTDSLAVPEELVPDLIKASNRSAVSIHEVGRGHVGLLSVDKRFVTQLDEGTHLFWRTGRSVDVRLIDTRLRTREVTGQEVLTADHVTIRVNISADYRVVDPVLATRAVENFEQALYLALQLAFRQTVGARTLDQMLAEKVSVDAEAAGRVRADMAKIGLDVGEIALKDVILPGEMRALLNQVVEAMKEAEANVIRRREETQATRALLNTAKVMEENPVMLRLKELEALTELAGKVERLTVHNGTDGLLQDLVRLRD
ncbi:MAG: slipin family protein [Pseudomonadota bacterium]